MAAVAIDSTDVCWAGGVHFSCPRITLLPRLLSLHGVLGAVGRMNICAGGNVMVRGWGGRTMADACWGGARRDPCEDLPLMLISDQSWVSPYVGFV